MFEPSLMILSIIIFVFLFNYLNNKKYAKQKQIIESLLRPDCLLHLKEVKCDTYATGAKNSGMQFGTCELFVIQDAIILQGYYKIFNLEINNIPIILSGNVDNFNKKFKDVFVIKPKKINPYSYDNEVFIEFGEASFTETNIIVRLKNISDNDKIVIIDIASKIC